MTGISKEDKAALLRFNITQTLQIKLTKLKVYTYSTKGAKPHKCHFCKYSSKFKSNVARHLRSHTGEKPFACTLCNYKSTQRNSLNMHILTHTGEKPLSCNLCKFKTSYKKILNAHITTHTGQKHYSCAFCTKLFSGNDNKNSHEKLCKQNPRQNDPSWVEMQKAFKCQLCTYSAAHKPNLKRHIMMIHKREKPFPCNLCNQKFSSRGDLQIHIFTRTREKPHNCQFCKRGFAQVAAQKSHEKICKLNPKQGDARWVKEQKKFKCHLCKYRSVTKGSLEIHLQSHTGEKPFKCALCLYKCSQNSNLHRHLRLQHTDNIRFECLES